MLNGSRVLVNHLKARLKRLLIKALGEPAISSEASDVINVTLRFLVNLPTAAKQEASIVLVDLTSGAK